MRIIYCDCCCREIYEEEPLFSLEISVTKGHGEEMILKDMCANCYDKIENLVNNMSD